MSPLNRQCETPLAQVGRRAAGLTCIALFVIACAHPTARADYQPHLIRLTPPLVSRGEVLTIYGEGFGARENHLHVFCSRKVNGHVSPDRENMRVVSWNDNVIRVEVPANLPQADAWALFVNPPDHEVLSNILYFKVRDASPPAVRGGGPTVPWLDYVHPEVVHAGEDVDIYGDFHKPANAAPRLMLVNRHGAPVERNLSTSIWTDRRIRAHIPPDLAGDDYQVFIRWTNILAPGADRQMHPRESNRQQLVVRTTTIRSWERGEPRITAIEPRGPVTAGGVIDILGTDLNMHGRRNIAITPYRYHPFNGNSDSAPTLQIISWSDTRIRARVPANLRTAEHFVFMYWGIDYEDRSNQVSLPVRAAGTSGAGAGILPVGQNNRQPAPPARSASAADRNPAPPARSATESRATQGPVPMTPPIVTQSGMTIENVIVSGLPGSQTLILRGRRFGTVRGEKIVSLNLNGRRYSAEVSYWFDNEVRVRVPANLPAGEYRVLVYYDASRQVSSNSQAIQLGRVDPPVVRRQPPPPARGVHRRVGG